MDHTNNLTTNNRLKNHAIIHSTNHTINHMINKDQLEQFQYDFNQQSVHCRVHQIISLNCHTKHCNTISTRTHAQPPKLVSLPLGPRFQHKTIHKHLNHLTQSSCVNLVNTTSLNLLINLSQTVFWFNLHFKNVRNHFIWKQWYQRRVREQQTVMIEETIGNVLDCSISCHLASRSLKRKSSVLGLQSTDRGESGVDVPTKKVCFSAVSAIVLDSNIDPDPPTLSKVGFFRVLQPSFQGQDKLRDSKSIYGQNQNFAQEDNTDGYDREPVEKNTTSSDCDCLPFDKLQEKFCTHEENPYVGQVTYQAQDQHNSVHQKSSDQRPLQTQHQITYQTTFKTSSQTSNQEPHHKYYPNEFPTERLSGHQLPDQSVCQVSHQKTHQKTCQKTLQITHQMVYQIGHQMAHQMAQHMVHQLNHPIPFQKVHQMAHQIAHQVIHQVLHKTSPQRPHQPINRPREQSPDQSIEQPYDGPHEQLNDQQPVEEPCNHPLNQPHDKPYDQQGPTRAIPVRFQPTIGPLPSPPNHLSELSHQTLQHNIYQDSCSTPQTCFSTSGPSFSTQNNPQTPEPPHTELLCKPRQHYFTQSTHQPFTDSLLVQPPLQKCTQSLHLTREDCQVLSQSLHQSHKLRQETHQQPNQDTNQQSARGSHQTKERQLLPQLHQQPSQEGPTRQVHQTPQKTPSTPPSRVHAQLAKKKPQKVIVWKELQFENPNSWSQTETSLNKPFFNKKMHLSFR
eukprot:TRINITY_DN9473_c0_g1_i2.p1 TRINITY_DN9473_c0_g1~~TRINITY_DN9473_c0_g1_i2.p1  ORF type:complete len:731 (-),score=106.91 TRINITY_DN9473_c0_g1_i2:169-2361(-)